MHTIYNNYINAPLADASYAEDGQGLQDGMPSGALLSVLSRRITPTLAQFISDNFEVVSHIETNDGLSIPPGSGFDATAWRCLDETAFAGQIYVSMRGSTGPLQDFLTDANL